LAMKILRNQNVPGSFNGGNTITFDAEDLTTTQQMTVTGIESPPKILLNASVVYVTSTSFLKLSDNKFFYPIVPVPAIQNGDMYEFISDLIENGSAVATTWQITTSAQPVTLNTPTPAPLPHLLQMAALPTFSFDYQGFSGLTVVTQEADIS